MLSLFAAGDGQQDRHIAGGFSFMMDLLPSERKSSPSILMAAFRKTRVSLPDASLSGVLTAAVLLCASSAIVWPQAQSGARPAPANAQSFTQFQSLSKRAMEALDADKLQEAIPLFRKALALNPRWVEGWWSLGTAYYDQESYAEAELAFQHVVAIDPKNGTARAFLGLCEFELGDDHAALRDIEAGKDLGINVDPQLRDVVFYHEGVLLQRAGRFIAAEKPFASLCQENGGRGDVARGFGMAALRMSDRQFPAPGSEAAVVSEQVGRAACIAAQKDFDSARRQFTLVISAYPHFPY
ncbi:MAG: tetratricopeptide repeat protein, partial [Candidatus Korobacteraceae bacterium]